MINGILSSLYGNCRDKIRALVYSVSDWCANIVCVTSFHYGSIPKLAGRHISNCYLIDHLPGCIPCMLYAEDKPILTIDSIVICQTHVGYLSTFVHRMHPGPPHRCLLRVMSILGIRCRNLLLKP
jgi:hypothetical protein